MNALAARRRHPAAIAILIMLGLFLTGAVYAAIAPQGRRRHDPGAPAQSVEEGKALFLANCASCHGLNAEGRATGNGDKRPARPWPASAPPRSTSRSAPAGCRWPGRWSRRRSGRGQVHRRADRRPRRLRRLARPRARGPVRRGGRPHQG